MGVRQNRNVGRQQVDYGVGARNEQIAITFRPIAIELAKAQARINRNALQVDTRNFFYFRRRRAGRLCSCILGNESTPSSTCMVCFGTGYVGGYDKYGTATEVLDVTTPGLILTNVHADYNADTRPTFFRLDDDARVGTIQAAIPLRTGSGYVDVLQAYDNASVIPGAVVEIQCRPRGTATWLPLSTPLVENILAQKTCDVLDVIVYMKRKSTRSDSPAFSHFFLRYGLTSRPSAVVLGDIPKHNETVTVKEFGFEEELGELSVFVDNRIVTYKRDDILYHIDKKKFWALTTVQPNISMGLCLNSDLTARYVQPYEIATRIPL